MVEFDDVNVDSADTADDGQVKSRQSYEATMREVTRAYLDSLDMDDPPTPSEIENGLSAAMHKAIFLRNAIAQKEDKWQVPKKLEAAQLADILMKMRRFVRVDFSDGQENDSESMPLCVYVPEEGLYIEANADLMGSIVREYCYSATTRVVDEVAATIRSVAPIVRRTRDANLDVCKNGIYERSTGKLLPFSPDYVFTTKTAVNYVEDPPLPVITMPDGETWDPETGMLDWANGDREKAEMLWQMVAAACRPNVRWNMSFWLYAKSGNNGKGTICQLIRNILGNGNHTSIPFAEFNNAHFMLTPLPRVQAVICDENQVGQYADNNVEFKSAVTNDVFRIDRKHKTSVQTKFYGLIIQCVNEIPRIRDRSDSFWRRICVIPFLKSFTGCERVYIKQDYIARDDVLEYIQWRALKMDFEHVTLSEECRRMLEEFKEESSPVLQFALEVLPLAHWDLLPYSLLWAMYKSWYAHAYNRQASGFSRNKFYDELAGVVESHPELGWGCDRQPGGARQGKTYSSSKYMVGPEPLLDTYGLADDIRGEWRNRRYTGQDVSVKCTPSDLKDRYRGLVRLALISPDANKPADDDPDDDPDGGPGGTSGGPSEGSDANIAAASPMSEQSAPDVTQGAASCVAFDAQPATEGAVDEFAAHDDDGPEPNSPSPPRVGDGADIVPDDGASSGGAGSAPPGEGGR